MVVYSPYQVGGSLLADDPSYVERSADSQLYAALKLGTFCYVLNSRQVGKSSLLVRTMHRLQQEGFHCATVEVKLMCDEQVTVSQWYRGIVADLWRGFRLAGKINYKTWWQEQEHLSEPQKLHDFIRNVLLKQFPHQQICIFIDEIDSVLGLKFLCNDFFALLRFCQTQRSTDPNYQRLNFVLFGVANPADFTQDPHQAPFNLGQAIALPGFQPTETEPLLQGLATQFENAAAILQEILAWTNGQPFLTQKLCDLAWSCGRGMTAEKLRLPFGTEPLWVEDLVRDRIIHQWESQDEPEHLRTIRDRLLSHQQRAGKLLELYRNILNGVEIIADHSPEQADLLLSGLVIKQGNTLQVKNRIYQKVFDLAWIERRLRDC
jgi:adenylate cyclase